MTILALMEAAAGTTGRRFRVRVIQAGRSLNNNDYPPDVLREAVPLFDGVRVLVKADAEHLKGAGRDPRAVIGRIVDPVFVPAAAGEPASIEAVFEAIDAAEPVIAKLRSALETDMAGLFGLSIDARAQFREAAGVRRATKFLQIRSVDLIVEPGAGGRVLDAIEAAPDPEASAVLRDKLIAKIKTIRPKLLDGRDVPSLTDDDLEGLFAEALGEPEAPGTVTGNVLEAVAILEGRLEARARVGASALPAAARTRVMQALVTAGTFTEAAVDKAIADELAYIGRVAPSGHVAGLGRQISRITTGETRSEKVAAMLEAFFDPAHKDHRHAQSIKKCYVEITGDENVTGRIRNCDEAWMREALSSSTLGDVLGDSITRRMLADYRSQTRYDIWRNLVTVTSVGDFRTQERVRWGGYGDVPVVAEGAPYIALSSPGDEKATYAASKRGGLETITLETIKNDDQAVVRAIPGRLAKGAKRTLSKFVLDFLRTNPVIYDTKALFHVDHGNLGSVALGSASFMAARLAMLAQAEAGSGARLSIPPSFLWVPHELEETARNLFVRNTNLDKTFAQTLDPQILPVWYWTDASDWCLSAAPDDIPGAEIGFLDGQEEPELLVQDSPTSGSMFTNDALTWKLRHIYGAAVTDYRAFYKAVVA